MTPCDLEGPLPTQLTTFIGREREIASALELLRSVRLLTLTGAGGSGKTRLALEVARRRAEMDPGGVVWVELAPIEDASLLPFEIARALGIHGQEGVALDRALAEVLRRRCGLLVLDNCEHLVDACAPLVDAALRGAPDLRVLATSREPLGVSGEQAWLVPPLGLPERGSSAPPTGDLISSEAVRLFVDRARAVRAGFDLTDGNADDVVEICRRLDGIPLAIELAAARTRMLSPRQILDRLDRQLDLLTAQGRTTVPRHRTLRATLDWSHELLCAREKALFRRLSVFSGGFTLEAVEAICPGGDVPADDVVDLLGSLVDRSLVTVRPWREEVRYEFLEPVRQYAREHLHAAGEAEREELDSRHARHFLALAEAAHAGMDGYRALEVWLPDLEVEQENLRTALRWSLEHDPGLALRLVGSLPYLWTPHPLLWEEGIRWTETAIAGAPADSPDHDRWRARWAVALVACLAHEWTRARAHLEEARILASSNHDPRSLALTLGLAALVTTISGDPEKALAQGEEATRLARGLDESWILSFCLVTGVAAPRRIMQGLEAAEPALMEALEASRNDRYLWGIWEAAMHLALLALERRQPAEAHTMAAIAADAAGAMGADWHATRILMVLAATLARLGDPERAGRVIGAAEGWLEQRGSRVLPADQGVHAELVADLTDTLGPARLEALRGEGRTASLADAIELGGRPVQATGGGDTDRGPTPGSPVPSSPGRGPARDSPPPAEGHGLRARALGPVEIEIAGDPLDPDRFSHGRPMELLFYLLTHPEGRTREQIGMAFWPDGSPSQVKNNCHVLLHKLRKALGDPQRVQLEGQRYRIVVDGGAWLDAEVFGREMSELLSDSSAHPSRDRLRDALELYRGDFLEGLPVGDWHLVVHDRLRRLQVDGLSRLADLQIDEGDHAGAVSTLERLVQREPFREDAYRRLMHCLTVLGRRDRALRHYARLRTLLADELHTEPETETVAFANQLRERGSP